MWLVNKCHGDVGVRIEWDVNNCMPKAGENGSGDEKEGEMNSEEYHPGVVGAGKVLKYPWGEAFWFGNVFAKCVEFPEIMRKGIPLVWLSGQRCGDGDNGTEHGYVDAKPMGDAMRLCPVDPKADCSLLQSINLRQMWWELIWSTGRFWGLLYAHTKRWDVSDLLVPPDADGH